MRKKEIYNESAERAVLGSLLTHPELLDVAMEQLKYTDFSDGDRQLVFKGLTRIYDEGGTVDLVSVCDGTDVDPQSLMDLMVEARPQSIDEHVKIVREKSVLRQLLLVLRETEGKVQPDADPSELLASLEGALEEVEAGPRESTLITLGEAVARAASHVELVAGGERGTGVPTGFPDLDKILGGLQDTDLIIIAGRPSMGKSAFAAQLALQAAKLGVGSVIFSLEMGATQFGHRLLCAEAKVDAMAARMGKVGHTEREAMAKAKARLADLPIYIDDTAMLSHTELRARARRYHKKHGIGLIIVDYIQLMRAPGMNRNANREQEVALISATMKRIAKELNIPMLALSQLSRAVEQTRDKRPSLAHLRESGAIEQDADVAMFLYRPEYYGIQRTGDDNIDTTGLCEVIIGKHRNGPTGTARLLFIKDRTQFKPFAIEEEDLPWETE